MAYFGYKVFTKKPPTTTLYKIPSISIQIEGPCSFIKIDPRTLNLIKRGDKEINAEGKVLGEVIWLGEAKPYKHKFVMDGNETLIIEDPALKELPAEIRLNADIIDDQIYYKGRAIKTNAPIYFKTPEYTVSVVPTASFQKKKEEKIKIVLYVIFQGLDADTLKMISVGDKELDSNGEVLARVLDIGKIESESREINLGDGNFILGENPYTKQVAVKMELNSMVGEDNKLYFKEEPVLHKSIIEFKTDKYALKGRIAKSYTEKPAPLEEKLVQIQLKVSGLIPEVAKIINEGDTEKEPPGKTVMVLKKILINKPSDVLILKEDQFLTLAHPFLRDLVIFLDVLTIEKEGVLYFKNYPVKIGNSITFTTDLYSISGTITGMGQR